MKKENGFFWAYLAATVSGVSVFINAVAVKGAPSPVIFTTAKNIAVSLMLLAIIFAFSQWKQLKKLSKKEWGKLVIVGFIGGSLPFLLFFSGLSMEKDLAFGAFIQKTLFVWVAIMAPLLIKEKINRLQYLSLAIILAGLYFAGAPKNLVPGKAEALILAATLLWSFEMIYVKKYLKEFTSNIAAFGRMFFGSIFMISYLVAAGKYQPILSFTGHDYYNIFLTSLFLVCYVSFLYKALYTQKAMVVSSILVLALPITIALQNIYQGKPATNITGLVIIILGVYSFVLLGENKPRFLTKWTG